MSAATPRGHGMERRRRLAGVALAVGLSIFSVHGERPARAGGGYAHNSGDLLRGCGSCHVGHGKSRSPMLPATEEQLCYLCHGSQGKRAELQRLGMLASNVSLRDVSRDFSLPYRHPVERVGLHSPREQLPERDSGAGRHAECVDCHRAHRTQRVSGSLVGGALPRLSPLDGASPEYLLCYRCHSDSANLPRTSSNVRRRLSSNNASFHPVEGPGRGHDVPSLRAPLTTASMIACSSCHGNDSGRGMHGSRFQYLLRKEYSTASHTPETPQSFALCYSCHDRQTLFSTRSFVEHSRHVQGQSISCASCHNAHGSYSNPHLIEFAAGVAQPDRLTGSMSYSSLGSGRGRCSVYCHGKNHSNVEYCRGGQDCTAEGSPLQQGVRRRRAPLRRSTDSPFSF